MVLSPTFNLYEIDPEFFESNAQHKWAPVCLVLRKKNHLIMTEKPFSNLHAKVAESSLDVVLILLKDYIIEL